jgi:hypothetical protein
MKLNDRLSVRRNTVSVSAGGSSGSPALREATAKIEPTTGAVAGVFTTGTRV